MNDRTAVYTGVSWSDLAASCTGKNVWVRLLPAGKTGKSVFFKVVSLGGHSARNGGVFIVRGETEDGKALALTGSSSQADQPADFWM